MQYFLKKIFNRDKGSKDSDHSIGEAAVSLVLFLKNQITDTARATSILETTKSFLKKREEEQLEQLSFIYLSYERYLTEIDTQKIYTRERLRDRVQEQFTALLTLPEFYLLFEQKERQQIALCKEFIKKLLQSTIETVGDAQDGLFKKMYLFAEEIPDIRQADYSFLEITHLPKKDSDWQDTLIAITQFIFKKLEHQFGESWVKHIFERTYNKVSKQFSALSTFPVVISLIPDKFLDADKIGRLSKHQLTNVLVEKTTYLEELNDTLQRKNQELRDAQQEILDGQKQIENTLRQLTSVLNTVNEGIISADATSTIFMVNREVEKIFGYSEEELIGQKLSLLMPESYRKVHNEGMNRYMRTRKPRVLNTTVKLEGRRKDGSIFPIEINIAETKLEDKIFFTAAVKDITARVEMEQELIKSRDRLEITVEERTEDLQKAQVELKETISELERSNQELEQFAYVASHDLQEPLRMVGSYTKLIKNQLGENIDDVTGQYFYFVIDGVVRMRKLISDLLHYSRVGKAKSNFQLVDMNDIIIIVQNNLRSTILSAEANITVTNLPQVFADKTLISQLYQNLIENAIKFRNKGKPQINIKAEELTKEWQFSIRDNGVGIATEHLDNIFKIFQRANEENIKGSGIGLAVCKKIVDLHKGNIWVISKKGEGSTFYFTLPK